MSIHTHGKRGFKANATDVSYLRERGYTHIDIGARVRQDREKFSDKDFESGPGFLAGDKGVYIQEGKGTERLYGPYGD
jgi:hypothetical protein